MTTQERQAEDFMNEATDGANCTVSALLPLESNDKLTVVNVSLVKHPHSYEKKQER